LIDCVLFLKEEEEADYKLCFPDYHTAFADILEDSGDAWEADKSSAQAQQQQQQATQAEACSASSKQLMQGQLLDDIVLQHARCAAERILSRTVLLLFGAICDNASFGVSG